MMAQVKEYTPDQIKDAEKMCQFLQNIHNKGRREYLVSIATAYISGVEHGIALERDAKALTTG